MPGIFRDGHLHKGPNKKTQQRRIKMMSDSHINFDGQFQSDKYPWCQPGFVPLKLTDRMAFKPLWDYCVTRLAIDRQFSNDLALCLARAGYGPAMVAVDLYDNKPRKEAFPLNQVDPVV